MRKLIALLSIPSAFAHTGEPVEQHGAIEIAIDNVSGFLAQYGVLLFGILFGLAALLFVVWLLRSKRK